jgi:hypothetical protein
MRKSLFILIPTVIACAAMAQVQPDTVVFDPASGNYVVQYMGQSVRYRQFLDSLSAWAELTGSEVDSTVDFGLRDTLVTAVFVPATKIDPRVFCRVVEADKSKPFLYTYRIENGSASTQNLIDFLLYFGEGVDVAQKSSNKWFDMRVMKPGVGTQTNAWDWSGNQGLEPTWSKGGFALESTGLPAITQTFFQGVAPGFSFPVEPPLSIDVEVARLEAFPANHVARQTIAPVPRPVPFVPLGFLDTIGTFVSRSRALGWVGSDSVANRYSGLLSVARTQLQTNDNAGARTTLQSVLHDVDQDSSTTLTSEAYALLRYNTEYLLARIPEPGVPVKIVSSTGARLTGGSLQYYEGSWKDAVSHNDGTFSVNTTLHTVSLRMTYAYGTQTKSNVVVGSDTVVFQTVSAAVRLVNSQSVPIDTGSVQYYAGAWRVFGTTSSGIASKELLPGSYSFRMTYASGSNDKQQDIGSNPAVTFQTAAASVQLQNSQGTLIDQGTVQYYAGAWRTFGTTSGGVATKELLPATYSFRMTYAFGSTDKQQNIGTNATVVFQTVAATVRLFNSAGSPLDQGTVQYYSGAWRDFGTTANGTVTKELLPRSYSFRMTHAFVLIDKTQDLASSPTVSFSTVLCTVRVKNAQGQPVNNALTSYYSGAWRQIGSTVNGEVTKELLPVNLTFRASSGGTSQDKAQNLSTNPVVEFVLQP